MNQPLPSALDRCSTSFSSRGLLLIGATLLMNATLLVAPLFIGVGQTVVAANPKVGASQNSPQPQPNQAGGPTGPAIAVTEVVEVETTTRDVQPAPEVALPVVAPDLNTAPSVIAAAGVPVPEIETQPDEPFAAADPSAALPAALAAALPAEGSPAEGLTQASDPVVVLPVEEPAQTPSPADIAAAESTSDSPPSADSDPLTAVDPELAILVNPLETGGPVHFVVEGVVQTLEPGEQHLLGSGNSWKVEFHRGDDFGDASHRIEVGVWRFTVSEQGWELIPSALLPAERVLEAWLD